MVDTQLQQTKKKALNARLARIEGQIRGVQRLIDEDSNCELIAQQLSAARKALDKAFYEMVSCALESKLAEHDASTPAIEEDISEIRNLLKKYG